MTVAARLLVWGFVPSHEVGERFCSVARFEISSLRKTSCGAIVCRGLKLACHSLVR